jgi:hypothetical protein
MLTEEGERGGRGERGQRGERGEGEGARAVLAGQERIQFNSIQSHPNWHATPKHRHPLPLHRRAKKRTLEAALFGMALPYSVNVFAAKLHLASASPSNTCTHWRLSQSQLCRHGPSSTRN